MAEQQLHSAQITSAAVDQHSLRTSQGVGTELGRIEPDACDPFMDKPSVLFRRQPMWTIGTTGEEQLIGLSSGQTQVLVDG
jgi:hypothetical protein